MATNLDVTGDAWLENRVAKHAVVTAGGTTVAVLALLDKDMLTQAPSYAARTISYGRPARTSISVAATPRPGIFRGETSRGDAAAGDVDIP